MEEILNPIELRVLGCLVEKETATPDNYPLTLNALCNACNQKSNRNPVLMLAEKSIIRAIDTLRMDHQLALQVTSTESRVPKYKHSIASRWELSAGEQAILCELILRGPQTPGDLRARASRLHPFSDKNEVADALHTLAERTSPMVVQLPREAGKREQRWAHLLAGEPDISEETVAMPAEPARIALETENKRIEHLEEEVATLKETLTVLQHEFSAFKASFE